MNNTALESVMSGVEYLIPTGIKTIDTVLKGGISGGITVVYMPQEEQQKAALSITENISRRGYHVTSFIWETRETVLPLTAAELRSTVEAHAVKNKNMVILLNSFNRFTDTDERIRILKALRKFTQRLHIPVLILTASDNGEIENDLRYYSDLIANTIENTVVQLPIDGEKNYG